MHTPCLLRAVRARFGAVKWRWSELERAVLSAKRKVRKKSVSNALIPSEDRSLCERASNLRSCLGCLLICQQQPQSQQQVPTLYSFSSFAQRSRANFVARNCIARNGIRRCLGFLKSSLARSPEADGSKVRARGRRSISACRNDYCCSDYITK